MRTKLSPNRTPPLPSCVKPALLLLVLLASLLSLAGCGFIRIPYPDITVTGDFSITVDPTSATVLAGSSGPSYSFNTTPVGGFSGVVSVALQPPAGFSCVPVSCSATLPTYSAANVLQVSPAASVAPGSYLLNFVATSGTLTHTVSATLIVQQSLTSDFSFTVSPLTSTLASGATGPTYSFTATPINSFSGTIVVTAAPPAGFTCVPVSCAVTLVNNVAVNALQIQPSAGAARMYTIPFTALRSAAQHHRHRPEPRGHCPYA